MRAARSTIVRFALPVADPLLTIVEPLVADLATQAAAEPIATSPKSTPAGASAVSLLVV
jgi:hypothetical protein